MLALCNHDIGVITCTVERKTLCVFSVHDSKSLELFKQAYNTILNDPKHRKPVLLVDGVSSFTMLLKTGLDLNKFTICLFASYKTIKKYIKEGIADIKILDMDKDGNAVTLKIAQINKALQNDKPGLQITTAAEEPKSSKISTFCKEIMLGGCMTEDDFEQVKQAYYTLLQEINMETIFEYAEENKLCKGEPLHDLIIHTVKDLGLDSNTELAVHVAIVKYIFNKFERPQNLLKMLSIIPKAYAKRIVVEATRKRKALRRAFFLTKNGVSPRQVVERTGVYPQDLLLAYTFADEEIITT